MPEILYSEHQLFTEASHLKARYITVTVYDETSQIITLMVDSQTH